MDIDKVDMADELDKSGVKTPTSKKKKKSAAPRWGSVEKWFYFYAGIFGHIRWWWRFVFVLMRPCL